MLDTVWRQKGRSCGDVMGIGLLHFHRDVDDVCLNLMGAGILRPVLSSSGDDGGFPVASRQFDGHHHRSIFAYFGMVALRLPHYHHLSSLLFGWVLHRRRLN